LRGDLAGPSSAFLQKQTVIAAVSRQGRGRCFLSAAIAMAIAAFACIYK
jgi:hypothetical protein